MCIWRPEIVLSAMEETLELLQTTLPCVNATAKIVSRPPFSFIRLAIEGIGLTPPSMPFNTEVGWIDVLMYLGLYNCGMGGLEM